LSISKSVFALFLVFHRVAVIACRIYDSLETPNLLFVRQRPVALIDSLFQNRSLFFVQEIARKLRNGFT
jgi:hypothetical protein